MHTQTKFQQIGVQYQQDAITPQEAKKSFSLSCRICTSRGINMDCDRCQIASAHNMTMAIFNDLAEYDRHKAELHVKTSSTKVPAHIQ